jgi:hypothetical protein
MESPRDQRLIDAVQDLRKALELDPSPDATHAVVGRFLRAVFPDARVVDRGGRVLFIAGGSKRPPAAEAASLRALARRATELAREISEWMGAWRQNGPSSATSIDDQLEAAKLLMAGWEARFCPRVTALRDELADAGLIDPQLDEHHQRPINVIGMKWVAHGLELLAREAERRAEAS